MGGPEIRSHSQPVIHGPGAVLRIKAWWPSLSLVRQFMLAGAALVVLGLGLLGVWTSSKIEQGIEAHSGARTALYMEGFVAPHLQELAANRRLSEENVRAVDILLARDASRIGVVAAKIWNREGVLLYATSKDQIGQAYRVTPKLARAWNGYIEVEFSQEQAPPGIGANGAEGEALLDIYVPIRHATTHDIIAVAQFSEIASELKREQEDASLEGVIVGALSGLVILAALFVIVANGNRIIETQGASLANRIAQLSELLRQNEELRQRVQAASRRSTEDTELHLRRLGADLHDGPAQLLALALLKFDRLSGQNGGTPHDQETIRSVLEEAMAEIRDISAGLALPEIEKLSLAQALIVVATEHERRTSTRVSCELSGKPIELSHTSKLCICRFVQEGLSNAFKHAGGVGQRVSASWTDTTIVVEVADEGPGLTLAPKQEKRPALGLIGLSNRLESLGGRLKIDSETGAGTRLTAYLPVGAGGQA